MKKSSWEMCPGKSKRQSAHIVRLIATQGSAGASPELEHISKHLLPEIHLDQKQICHFVMSRAVAG